jgi:hypothetical protein
VILNASFKKAIPKNYKITVTKSHFVVVVWFIGQLLLIVGFRKKVDVLQRRVYGFCSFMYLLLFFLKINVP